jgi:hypothetical protein
MYTRSMALFILGTAAFPAGRPIDYSTDMVMIESGRVMQTLRLNVSGQKSRVEGFTAGPLGRIVTIARKDRGVVWTLYLDRGQYSEQALSTGSQAGKMDLATFDVTTIKGQTLGSEVVLGHYCTKTRITTGPMPNGRPLVATVWVAEDLRLPLRLETMGITQENRNLVIARQAAALFEIPAGFTPMPSPGRTAASAVRSTAASTSREAAMAASGSAGDAVRALAYRAGGRFGQAGDLVTTRLAESGESQRRSSLIGGWRMNTNLPGGDYRTVDMRGSDPSACKALCDREQQCRAWTLVKPDQDGGRSYCWLKDSVPAATREECCISGIKSESGETTTSSRYRFEQNVNRYGDDYRDFLPTQPDATQCAAACSKESRCRSWTWVKESLEGPTGHCWLKRATPPPTPDDCCVSGLKQ